MLETKGEEKPKSEGEGKAEEIEKIESKEREGKR